VCDLWRVAALAQSPDWHVRLLDLHTTTHAGKERLMADETMKAALEAQWLMGHCDPQPHHDPTGMYMDDHEYLHVHPDCPIIDWSWEADEVRQQLHVPLNALWHERVMALMAQALAEPFLRIGEPWTYDSEGNMVQIPQWEDTVAIEDWTQISIFARGVLTLATLYGRPYVRFEESPALLAHWQLVQAEAAAQRHRRNAGDYSEAQYAEEYPEKAVLFTWGDELCAAVQQAWRQGGTETHHDD
jgi:hypothetical protein